MLFRCTLLFSLIWTAVPLGLRNALVTSVTVNAAELKGPSASSFLQTGEINTQASAATLRYRAQKLEEELSDLSSQDPDMEEEEVVDDASASGGGKRLPASVTTRPSVGKGPDVVTFGLFGKSFYGINLKTNSFVIDLVMTLKWVDKRVTSLIPEGLPNMTLSKLDSEKKIWLPGIAVTNRDIGKYDLISTAVFINTEGEVFKVERATAVVKNKFLLDDFPFDRQRLVTQIASHKYMADQVQLQPSTEGVGVNKDLFDGESYSLTDIKASAIEDGNGALKKSRGLLTLTVDRDNAQYVQSHLIGTVVMTMMSWAVFWFPFSPPFTTPRLTMSIVSLVNFTYLTISSASVLPPGAPPNWNDIINQAILTLMFSTVVLNILSEICLHQLKVEELAKAVNHECKALMPFLSILCLSLILSAAGHVEANRWMSYATASTVVHCVLTIGVGGYVALTGSRIMSALAKKRMQDASVVTKK
jgi:hypothetical protein